MPRLDNDTALRLLKRAILEADHDDDDEDDEDMPRSRKKHSMTPEMQIDELTDYCKAWNVKHDFEIGDVVQIKSDFNGYHRFPKKGQPAVVVHKYDVPLVRGGVNAGDSGSPYYGLPEDLRIAVKTPDGKVMTWTFWSVFLEPWDKTKQNAS